MVDVNKFLATETGAASQPEAVGDEKELVEWYKRFRPNGRVITEDERLTKYPVNMEKGIDPRNRPAGSAETMGIENIYPKQDKDVATIDEIRRMKETQGYANMVLGTAPWIMGPAAISAVGLPAAAAGTVLASTGMEALRRATSGKESTPDEGIGRVMGGAGSWLNPKAESEMSAGETLLKDLANSATYMGGPTALFKGAKAGANLAAPVAKNVFQKMEAGSQLLQNNPIAQKWNTGVDKFWTNAVNYVTDPNMSLLKDTPLPETFKRYADKAMTPAQRGGKFLREMLQPAVERLNPTTQQLVRKARAQGAVLTQEEERIGGILANPDFTLQDKTDFLKIMRGASMRHADPKVKALVKESRSRMRTLGVDPFLLKTFNAKKAQLYTKMLEAPQDVLTSKHTRQLMETIDTSIPSDKWFRQGKVRQAIGDAIADPGTSEAEAVLLKEIFQLPATTPELAMEASSHAMTAFLKRNLLALKGADSMIVPPGHVPPAGYVKSTWGGLGEKGYYMHRDLALELESYHKIQNNAKGVFNKYFTSPWKTMKIIMSPAAQIRNVFTNFMLNDIGGLPFYRADIYAEAVRGLQKSHDTWKDFARLTGGGGTFQHNELAQLATAWKYHENFWDMPNKVISQSSKYPKMFYNANEQVFKFAKYLHNIEKGMSKAEAATDALIPTFNYSEITPAVSFARSHLVPFATWTTKVIPYTFEMAVKHPVRVGKWFAFYEGLQTLALQQADVSEEEWQEYKKRWPEHMKKGLYLLLPWRDSRDRLNMVDLTYMVPGVGDIRELAGKSVWESMFQHPALTVSRDLVTGTTFTGEPFVHDWQPAGVKAKAYAGHLLQSVMPSWFGPWGTDYKKYMKALSAQPGAMTVGQAIASQFGAKMQPLDDQHITRLHDAMRRVHLTEMTNERNKELRMAGEDLDERQKILEKYSKIRRKFILEHLGVEDEDE